MVVPGKIFTSDHWIKEFLGLREFARLEYLLRNTDKILRKDWSPMTNIVEVLLLRWATKSNGIFNQVKSSV